MERKIGEIFEYNGEWYQCIKNDSCCCDYCDFGELGDCDNIACASGERNDNKEVHFKKLEKVGEPYMLEDKKFQKYRVFHTPYIYNKIDYSWQSFADPYYISLEIKQDKEDMEDLDKIKVRDYTKVEELNVMEEKKLNLKPFDIQKAREGKPVCTRDGRKARIICFDVKWATHPIIALIEEGEGERICSYMPNGRRYEGEEEWIYDLMMLPEKKEGWVNVYYDNDACSHRGCRDIYDTKEQAIKEAGSAYITTVKINWEE